MRFAVKQMVLVAALAVLANACTGFEHTLTPTIPSDTTLSYLGDWTSASLTSFPTPQSCGGVTWKVTSQQGNTIAGEFQVACAGGVTLSGVANGTIAGDLTFQAAGTATGLGPLACAFTLSGTGVLQTASSILVTYAGSTCAGPVSGSEIIRR